MPSRITPFVNGEFYHVYNRGSEKRPIFGTSRDHQRFIKTIKYYQIQGPKPKFSHSFKFKSFRLDPNKKIVEIICFCLMPNHFHLLIKQLKDGGITEFISKLSNSYTKYYNTKYNRVGPLLQGEFKAVFIESDEQLLHISRYIHLNPLVSYLVKNLEDYGWSSYLEYVRNLNTICDKEIILNFFSAPEKYQQFVLDQADYGMQLELIKHKLLDEH